MKTVKQQMAFETKMDNSMNHFIIFPILHYINLY